MNRKLKEKFLSCGKQSTKVKGRKMLVKEFRIPMPLSTDEYKIGQLYMIAKHSHEQSEAGEGVEVIHNVPHHDEKFGDGRYTEKRIYLNNRLPYWLQAIIPRIFYLTEKSWNYYPYTETEYTCSFVPKLSIFIKTRFEDNNGSTENSLNLNEEELAVRSVEYLDIAYDEVAPKHYKEFEDPKFFKSSKTGRGPLMEGWRDNMTPMMCSYKVVTISFEVWGLQTKGEELAYKAIKEILLVGHRQAFAWIDEWFGMTEQDVRDYEEKMQTETNQKVRIAGAEPSDATTDAEQVNFEKLQASVGQGDASSANNSQDQLGNPVMNAAAGLKSWFGWN